MRPKKPETTRSGDLFRARLDQIINLKHEPAQLTGQINGDFIDGEIAPLYSDKGRVIGVYGMTAVGGAKRTFIREQNI
jgi:IS5 family transposase